VYRAWLAFALACLAGATTVVLAVAAIAIPPLFLAAVAAGAVAAALYRHAHRRMVAVVYDSVDAERNPDGTLGEPGANAEREATGRVEYEPRDDWDDPEDWPWDDPFWTAEEPIDDLFDEDGSFAGDASRSTDGGTRSRATGGAVTVDPRTREACDVLGVDPDDDLEAVRCAYRERVKETHPDRGGDREEFKRVRWAYEYLRREAERSEAS
jgi:hypothetical protein